MADAQARVFADGEFLLAPDSHLQEFSFQIVHYPITRLILLPARAMAGPQFESGYTR